MKALAKRLIALGATSVIAVSGAYLVEPWEGTKNQAYRDMVGIPTICAGYTIGVKMGDYKTDQECDELLVKELTDFNTKMMKSVKVPLPENMEVAYTSLVWNIGLGAWKSSTLLKKLNNQEYEAACEQILRWNKAGGKVVKGLQNRREDEYKVCMGKDADVNSALKELTLTGQEPLSVDENAPETFESSEGVPTPTPSEINAPEPLKPIERTCTKKFLFWCIKWSDSAN